ncbi:uncharacterized protein LOC125672982 [Ostrea edulis]|uniref:uncharacterized protein LOC125672982 n=1 Tax=Ostrea edulis TaxID=37623 RepID=UPI0024AEAE36|nr:uncharacterized protein LOC125672982 [Ostrea edulis]
MEIPAIFISRVRPREVYSDSDETYFDGFHIDRMKDKTERRRAKPYDRPVNSTQTVVDDPPFKKRGDDQSENEQGDIESPSILSNEMKTETLEKISCSSISNNEGPKNSKLEGIYSKERGLARDEAGEGVTCRALIAGGNIDRFSSGRAFVETQQKKGTSTKQVPIAPKPEVRNDQRGLLEFFFDNEMTYLS